MKYIAKIVKTYQCTCTNKQHNTDNRYRFDFSHIVLSCILMYYLEDELII
jgi:hypothetical protein